MSDMVSTGTYIRLLRHLGIALIFAPEPFTTPFGVACILAARHLSKQHEANVNNRLREMIQYYLAHTSRLADYVDSELGSPAPAKRHNPTKEKPILGQITGSRSFEANSSVLRAAHELHESAARRTPDMQSLPRRYQSTSTAVARYNWTTISGDMEGVTHHSVNMALLPQHYGTGGVRRTKAVFHATNRARLRQDRGATAAHTTVHKALRDNNHYYDMLSRKNVIRGY